MRNLLKKMLVAYFLFIYALNLRASSSVSIEETHYLKAFQYADVVGVGTVVGHHDNSLVIDVNNYWTGSFATNPVAIDGAFSEWTDDMLANATNCYSGKSIVFFAMTNEWKSAAPKRPKNEYLILDTGVCLTNIDGFCAPKFIWSDPPTWFALETNDEEHLVFYSNIVQSIVVTKDRSRLYTTLRDAIKSDESGEQPYKGMSFRPLWELLWTADETNLVKALYDPLLAPRFRSDALFQLQKRFGWPATNTVPEP